LLLVAFLLVNAPNCHLSLVLASVVQDDAVNCNKWRPMGTWEKGHKSLSVTPSIEDRLEPKGRSRTSKLRVKVCVTHVATPRGDKRCDLDSAVIL